MKLREMVRSVIREEMPGASDPVEPERAPLPSVRQAIFDRIKALQQEQTAALEATAVQVGEEEARLASLEAEASAIRARIGARQREWYRDELNVSFALQRELAALRDTCSPLLDEFIKRMNDEHGRLMKVVPRTAYSYGERQLLADNPKREQLHYSNAPAIKRRILAVFAARNRAEELKYLHRTEAELRQELEGLASALPSIDGELELMMREARPVFLA